MTKRLALAALAVLAVVASLALRKQNRWAQKVNRFSAANVLVAPIDVSTLLEMQAAASARGLKPRFTYATVALEDGRRVPARPAYYEPNAPEGAVMTISPMDFLLSARDDSGAEAVALNPGLGPELSATVEKGDLMSLVASLERRGFRASSQAAPASPVTAAPPAAPEPPPIPNEPGTWTVKIQEVAPEKKVAVIVALRRLSGKGLAEVKELVESAPGVVGEGLSANTSHRWFETLTAAGASGSRYDAGGPAPQ